MPTSDARRLMLVGAAALAGCSDGRGERLPCGHGGKPLAATCSVERTATPQGVVLTLRNPDGGFHRVLATRDGRGLVAADGAEAATVTPVGAGEVEVRLGGDRYRLPATIR